MDFIVLVIRDTLQTLYQIFGISVIVAILFMFAYLYCREHGIKEGIRQWIEMLKTNKDFRKILAFVFYTAMLLNKTLFCRQIWGQPFKNILGVWGFYDNGKLYTENVENILLFVPFQFFLMWTLKKNLWSTDTITAKSYYGKAILISFGTSLGIEMAQLFLKVGAFQLSDLFFNTLGGIIGAAAFQALERKRKRL